MRFHEDVWESLGRRQVWMMHETNKPGTMLINCRGQQRFLSTNDSECIGPIPQVAYHRSVCKL